LYLSLLYFPLYISTKMAGYLEGLRPQIRQILSSPGTDLATISAKRVRRRLLEMEALTPEFVKENKDAVDAVISSVYEKVQAGRWGSDDDQGQEASGSAAADSGGERDQSSSPRKKRVKNEDEEGAKVERDTSSLQSSPLRKRRVKDEEEDRDVSSPPPKKAKKAVKMSPSKLEQSDAELARQLSNEINSRSRRSTTMRGCTSVRNRNGTAKGGRKAKSSAEVMDSDDEVSGGERRSTPKKKRAGGTAKGGFAKEYILSEPLSVVVGADKLSRPQVVKQLWVYIKDNELQNPANKQEILCDENLRAVFNADKVNMFRMNKTLGQHLHEEE